MRTTESPQTDWLSKRRRYRQLMFGSLLGAVAVGLALRAFDLPLVGEAVYWLGIVAFVAIWKGTDVELMDERDWELERRASLTALKVVGPVLVLAASAVRLLPLFTSYTVPPIVVGGLFAYMGLFAVFVLAYLWHRSRV